MNLTHIILSKEHRQRIQQERNRKEASTSDLMSKIEQAVQQKKESMVRREAEKKSTTLQLISEDESGIDPRKDVFEEGVDLGGGVIAREFLLSFPRQGIPQI